MMEKMDTMSLLLGMEIPEPLVKEFCIKRLSEITGGDVVFRLRSLGYNKVADLRKREESDVHTVLAGTETPNFKNKDLQEKFKAATSAELVKKMMLPGEIEEIAREIERLSGYRMRTIEDVEEIKKKSMETETLD